MLWRTSVLALLTKQTQTLQLNQSRRFPERLPCLHFDTITSKKLSIRLVLWSPSYQLVVSVVSALLFVQAHPIPIPVNHHKNKNNNNAKMSSTEPLKAVVFCGPSGVGKGTLIGMLMQRFPNDQFGFSVSHTTRPPRDGEVDGVHYNFTTIEDMKKDIADGKFIEYAEVHGKYYGTSIAAVETVQASGKICILDIDVQGVQKVKQSPLQPYYIFISPPSMEALEKRLRGRGTEAEEQVKTRLANAAKELEYGQQAGNFDRVFVNADLKQCFEDLVECVKEWYPHLVEMAPDDDTKTCSSKCLVS